MERLFKRSSILVLLASAGTLFGCAHYEVNTGRGNIPGHYIRYEMQEADRAVEAARAAGKDKTCPEEFKQAEAAKDHAYDVFRECHTEEGAALAKQATAMANALCPPKPEAEAEAPLVPLPASEPAPGRFKYCMTLRGEFDVDRADLRPELREEASRVGNFMKKYPTTSAVIEGHTDNVGTTQHNQELSKARADAVVNLLATDYGIDRSRLTAQGFGDSRPLADNSTEQGRAQNRRIEAVIDCAFDVREVHPPEKLCIGLMVQFDTGKSEIKPQYQDELAKLGEYLQKNPTTTALIEGHTDNQGGYDYNMKLSLERAQAVVHYLEQKFAIDGSRLSAKGYGYSRRVAYNSTPEGRALNRRINAVVDCVVKK